MAKRVRTACMKKNIGEKKEKRNKVCVWQKLKS